MDKNLPVEYPFKKIFTRIYITKLDDGGYTVLYELEQYRSLDDKTWEERRIMSSSTASEEDKAMNISLKEILIYLNSVGGDLFNSAVGSIDKETLL